MKTNQLFHAMVGAALLSGVALAEPDGPQGQGPRGDGPGFRPEGQARERMQPRGPEGAGCPMMQRGGPGPGMEIGRKGFHNPERLKEAGATDKQLEALKTFANEQQFKRIDLQAAAEKAELALSQLMDSEAADEKAALQAVDTLSQARAELFKLEVSAKLKMREILGADVLKKLRQMGPPEGMDRPGRGPRAEGQGQPRKDRGAPPEGGRPQTKE